jgi:hypothetical protein
MQPRRSASQPKPTTVAIVEDDERLRASLSLRISRTDNFAIAGVYPDTEFALAWSGAMLRAVLAWRHAGVFFEGYAEILAVLEPHPFRNFRQGQAGLQQ